MESRSITKIQSSRVDENNNLVLEILDEAFLLNITLNADLQQAFERVMRKWKVVREKREEIRNLRAVIESENKR